MYKVNVSIEGTVGLLQNKFSTPELEGLMKGAKKNIGREDYSLEWMEKSYITEGGQVYQPASHIEGSLVKSAVSFKIKGKFNKTWKDAIRAYVYCVPDEIPMLFNGKPIKAPGSELITKPTSALRVDIRRVKVQRAAVARSRLMINEGWQLDFVLEVQDNQVRDAVLREILEEAGRAVGIGDFRPRYGRFAVTRFDIVNGQ